VFKASAVLEEDGWTRAWTLDWRFIIFHHVAILKTFVSQNFKVKNNKTKAQASRTRGGMMASRRIIDFHRNLLAFFP